MPDKDTGLSGRRAHPAPASIHAAIITAALVFAASGGAQAVGVQTCDPAPGPVTKGDLTQEELDDGVRPPDNDDYSGCYQAAINFLDPGDDGANEGAGNGPQNQFEIDSAGRSAQETGRHDPTLQGVYHYNLFHDLQPFTFQGFAFAPGLTTSNSEFTLRALRPDGTAYTNRATHNQTGGLHSNNNGWGVRHVGSDGQTRTPLQGNQILELAFAFRNENGFAATAADSGGIVNCEVNGAEGQASTRGGTEDIAGGPGGTAMTPCSAEQGTANARTNQVLQQGATSETIEVGGVPPTIRSAPADTAGGAAAFAQSRSFTGWGRALM